MEYSELIKNFAKIREYVRQFYVYGFRSRSEFSMGSARKYDDERRRVESWLGEYMQFRQEEDGKIVFMSIDSRSEIHNPLYKAFKTKSFTDNEIAFHFYILDLLSDTEEYTVKEILNSFSDNYSRTFDESIVRKKLKEYVDLGIIKTRKEGKEVFYSCNKWEVNWDAWAQAIHFFTEEAPLGVAGSYLLDRTRDADSVFRFKHSYIFQALDSQILFELLGAINEKQDVELEIKTGKKAPVENNLVHPLKIYISTQSGRQYLLCYHICLCRVMFVRLDNIISLKVKDENSHREEYMGEYDKVRKYLWGVSFGDGGTLHRVEMTVHIEKDEEYVYNRLLREKRIGCVERRDENTRVFTADVYDVREMLPWIRTFIGRIKDFYCTDPLVTEQLNSDIEKLGEYYGGDWDAVQ